MTMIMERPAGEAPLARRRPHRPRSEAAGGRMLTGEWMGSAACQYEDPELFFDGLSPVSRQQAKAVCRRCPVREACLLSAMAEERAPTTQTPDQNRRGRYGIRGGLTSGERWLLAYPGEKPRPAEADAP